MGPRSSASGGIETRSILAAARRSRQASRQKGTCIFNERRQATVLRPTRIHLGHERRTVVATRSLSYLRLRFIGHATRQEKQSFHLSGCLVSWDQLTFWLAEILKDG
jgi:hypothetical protein